MKYRNKLLVGMLLISSISLISITQLSLFLQKVISTQEIELKEQMVGPFLERFLFSVSSLSSLEEIDELITQMVALEPIAYVHIYDENENLILGHGLRQKDHKDESSTFFDNSSFNRVLLLEPEPIGNLEVHYGLTDGYQKGWQRNFLIQLYAAALLFLFVMMLAAYFALRVYAKELTYIRSALYRIASGEFNYRLSERECGELVLTAKAINTMCEKLESHEERSKTEHMRLKELSFVVENSPVSVFMTDSAGRIIYVNPIFLATTGYEADEVLGETPNLLNSGENDRQEYVDLWRTIKAGKIWRGELINRRKDGSLFCDKTIIAPVKDDGEQVTHYITVKEDITEYKQVEKRLRATQSVFEAASEAIMVTDPNGFITMVNPAFYEITGYEEEEIVGKNPKVFSSGHHDEDFYRKMYQELLKNNRWEGEIWNRRKSGEVYPQWQTISLIRDEEGEPLEYVALFSDITKRKAEEDEIRYRANYDPLTGLANRALFFEQLDQVLKQAKRHKQGAALLYLDLDGFKAVNDEYGHYAGDCVLQIVAEILTNTVRESDSICRMGGDEFVISLSQVTTRESLELVATKIIEKISAPIEVGQNAINIGASVGISLYPIDTELPGELISLADTAMYQAKQEGKNRFRFSLNV